MQALPAAREMLQLRAGEPIFRDGAFHAAAGVGALVRSVTLPEVARRMAAGGHALSGHGDNRCDVFTFPSGAHAAEVEVDPETGQVTLARYTAVDDYGRLLNPLLTEGQVQGGLAQGIGQALLEEALYDPRSGQLLSATFMDYAMPRGGDLPALDVRFFERPTAANPLGAKGSGQAGTIGAAHTVVAAALDALRPLGVHAIDMPLTPERVWRAITAARLTHPVARRSRFHGCPGPGLPFVGEAASGSRFVHFSCNVSTHFATRAKVTFGPPPAMQQQQQQQQSRLRTLAA